MASDLMRTLLAAKHVDSKKVLNETRPLAEIRAEQAAQAAAQRYDPAIQFADVDAGGVPAIWVTPPRVSGDLVYLFFHGGAYVKANVTVNHNVVINACTALSARGLTVDYRVGPEHPFPAAVDDAVAAYEYLLNTGCTPGRIVVAGSSAGGGLSLALLLALRERGVPLPAAAAPISPWADLTQSGASMQSRAERDPSLTKRYLDRFAADYLQGHDPTDPLASPVFADYAGLAPILAQVGSEEILYDDAARVVQRARAAGVAADLDVTDQAYHGFQNAAPELPEAVDAGRRMAAFARRFISPPVSVATG